MSLSIQWRWLGPVLGGIILASAGCVEDKEGSLFDPNVKFTSAAVLNSVAPADSAQAGVDSLTISGSGFSTVQGNNIVYVNATPATVFQAGPAALLVKAPLVIGDSVAVRVAIRESDKMSNLLVYKLTAAIESFGLLGQTDVANAIAVGSTGDVYVSVTVGGIGQGIAKIVADGSVSQYAPDSSSIGWSSLKFGPGGYLYAARGNRAIYRFSPGGGSPAVNPWAAFASPANITITDLDFDQNQILWAAGSNTQDINNARVFSVSQTVTKKAFPFAATVRSIRVFNNYLYMAALVNSKWGIWRGLIVADSLRTPELYFDFDAAFASLGYVPQGITFSANGDLFIATGAPAGFVVVAPTRSAIVPYADYVDLFGSALKYVAWGPGTVLYAATTEGTLVKIYARRLGAPYYGP